ncbi:MAG: aminotransferase class V-fold PLP-dependent enzyme [Chloroflexi bacterium]|nr:aminotransferase class V-fold PLP-dependent enzyme [Chloroflexota bacterium]MBM4431639.1 aminotransferase class V-fold PLP-dependent enzyme [Chloroflexota bacterium]
MHRIYLDYNATTPLDPMVFEAMTPYLREHFGNPSSGHWFGVQARVAVEHAREQVAALLDADPSEIVFTSGGSESDNWAIKGIAEANSDRGDHIITSQIEHPAVLNTCRYLEGRGFRVTYLPVDGYGQVDPDDVTRAITLRTTLISIMHANNEVGTLQPIATIGAVARERGIFLHTDAAQSVGKIPTDVKQLRVDLLTVAGHKLYAPKGVGVLYIRRGTRIALLIHGAGHEAGRRAGTENVAGLVGLGQACAIAAETMAETAERLQALRDRLHEGLANRVAGLHLNGHPTQRLPNTLNLSFEGLEGNALLEAAPEIAASIGSACHAGTTEPSPVLTAMGIPPEIALGAIRFSLGKQNSQQEIDWVVELLADKVAGLRTSAIQNRYEPAVGG